MSTPPQDGPPAIPDRQDPVTTIVARRVLPGKEREYEDWLRGVMAATASFPGHQGATVVTPRGPGDTEYVIVFRFATMADLQRWKASPVRAEWLARAEPLICEPAIVREQVGLEPWFSLPGRPNAGPPPRYKMAVVTWLALFPTILGVAALVDPLIGGGPLTLRVAISSAVSVALMTWVLMPRATRLFSSWLYPKR